MTTAAVERVPRFRLGLMLWTAGAVGVGAITGLVLPGLIETMGVPVAVPLPLVMAASAAQSAVLLALAVWAGVALAGRVGLHAPVFEALAQGRPVGPALRTQLGPGLVGGVLMGAVVLVGLGAIAPPELAAVQARFNPPLLVRLLYGGVTEELLLRWGLMTALVWLGWRFMQRSAGAPRAGVVWASILISALLFGAGHLPAASLLLGGLTAPVVAFIVGANALFGTLAGFLFWRYGLEAAMLAHAAAHVVGFAAGLL